MDYSAEMIDVAVKENSDPRITYVQTDLLIPCSLIPLNQDVVVCQYLTPYCNDLSEIRTMCQNLFK